MLLCLAVVPAIAYGASARAPVDTATVADRAPIVSAPAVVTVPEAGAAVIVVHATDPDGQPLTLSGDFASLPAGYWFRIAPGDTTAELAWFPTYLDAGEHVVTFRASNTLTGTATTRIVVTNVDLPPTVTAPDTVAAVEASPVTIHVKVSDGDGDAIGSLTADLTELPPGNGAVFTADPGGKSGTLTWTPGYADAGTYWVAFNAANALEGQGGTRIMVKNTDRAPVVTAPATAAGPESGPITVTVRAADPDGDPITSLAADLGSLPAGNDAVFTPGPGDTTGTLTWTPTFDDAGVRSITFTAGNAKSGSAATAITVTNVDRPPVLTVPAQLTVREGEPIVLTVLAADPDGTPIEALTADLSGLPAGVTFVAAPGNTGGTLTWTPTYAQAGDYTAAFFAASDGLSTLASTEIRVTDNRAPVVTAPAAVTVDEGGSLVVAVHATDPDGEPITSLTANFSTLPAGVEFLPDPGDTTGKLMWVPSYGDSGEYHVSFTAANTQSGSAETRITVANVDLPPAITAPAGVSVAEASPLGLSIKAADPDGDAIASLTADLSGLPAGNDAVFTAGPGGKSGNLTWTPRFTDAGTYWVTFRAANALSFEATVQITVTNTDRAPAVVAPATAATLETKTVTVTVHARDVDGDPITSLTADFSGLPAGSDAVFTPGPGDSIGTLTWTPTYDDAGSHTVTFAAGNALSGTASTVITVENVDRPPVVTVPAAVSSPEGSLFTLTVHAIDPDGQPILSLLADFPTLPQGATFAVAPDNSSGTLSWMPGYNDAGSYKVTFLAAAGGLSDIQSTDVTITNTDRAPAVTVRASVTALETSPVFVMVRAADADGQPVTSLTADLSGLPAGNDAVFTAAPGDSVGTLSWTPTYADAGDHTITFTAANTIAGSAATVIHVANLDREPEVAAPSATVAEGGTLSLVAHASDIDGDPITYLDADLSELPAGNATFTPGPGDTTGTLTWTPSYDDAGTYTVTFSAENDLYATASAVITVTNTDRAPVVAVPADVPAAEATSLTLVIHAADPDGQPLGAITADLSHLPAGNNAVFTPGPGDSTATLTWTPTYADAGDYAVSITAANGLSGVANAVIHVANTDRAPTVAAPTAASVAENAKLTLRVHAADPDHEAITSLSADVSGLPAGNNAAFVPDPGDTTGTFTWTPTFDDQGSRTVTFLAANAMTGSASTVVFVANVDRPPVLTAPATVSSPEAIPLVITVQSADPDSTPVGSLLADLTGMPPGATFTVTGTTIKTGTLSWTPNYFQAGAYRATFFTASGGKSATATTAITITNNDRAPLVSAPAAASVAETGTLAVTVHALDLDGEPITSFTADVSGLPAGHDAVFTPGAGDSTGTLTWTPTYADSGAWTVTFIAANAIPGSAATVIHVSNVDRAPTVSAPAAAAIGEGSPLTVTVHAADPDGDAITSLAADLSGLPAGATFTPAAGNAEGTLSWTPGYEDAGAYSVTFSAGNAMSATPATTAITVSNTDRAPVVAAPAAVSVAENGLLAVTVHAADPDGQPLSSLTADLSQLPPGAAFNADAGDSTGTLTWTPGWFDSGAYTVTFTAANALQGAASTAITVTNVDRAPSIVAPATAAGAETQPITITVHAADIDQEAISALSADLSGLPPGGEAVFTPGPGDTTGTLTWTPSYDAAGTWTVSFTAANAMSATTSTAITVSNVDRPPVLAAPATVSLPEGSPFTLRVHAADPDGDAIQKLAAVMTGLPPGATFTAEPGDTAGTLSWTPGYQDAGEYLVGFSATNALSSLKSTVLTVTNTDRAPAVAAPATAKVAEASPVTIVVHAADADGDPISSLTVSGLPPGADAVFTPDAGDTTGTLVWTPGYFDAGVRTLQFTAANALSGSASTAVTVTNVDRAPLVAAPAAVSVAEQGTLTFRIHAADLDGDPIIGLAADLSHLPEGASFEPDAGDTSGTLTWTPGYDDAGTYTVTFIAINAVGGTATTAITVTNVDRAPEVAAPATATIEESDALHLTVHAADPDGEPITSLIATGLPPGATFLAGAGDTTGTLAWTPGYDQAGSYAVTFTAANALPGGTSTSITVINVDRAPLVAAPATAATAEASPLSITVHATDLDGDPITSFGAAGLPAGATFTPDPGDTTGTLSWIPGYADAGTYTVTYTAANAHSGTATTVITVSNVDRAPVVATPARAFVAEDAPLTFVVHAADADGDAIASLTATGLPPGAAFAADAGDTSGTFTWTPGYADAGKYAVTFTAANALSGGASIAITVRNVDRAPVVAAPAAATVAEGAALSFTVHAADADGEPITSLVAQGLPAGAAFTADAGDTSGTLSWTPGFGDAGGYTVTFTAANALSGAAATTITVTNVDRPPVVSAAGAVAVAEASSLELVVHAADPDGDPLASLSAAGLPPGATFTADAGDTSGTLSWVPGYADAGSYTVVFSAANALAVSASTVITVTNVDRAPAVSAPATASVGEASTVGFTVHAADPDGQAITALTASGLPAGAVFIAGDGDTTGTLSWNPDYDTAGSYTVTFTAANALSGAATTVITVNNVDRPPVVAAPATASIVEGGLLTIAVHAADPDGEAITSLAANLSGLPAGAKFSAGPGDTTGTFTWVPAYTAAGSYAVSFTATNALFGSAGTVIVVVDSDQPPTVTAPAAVSAAEASPITVDITAGDQDGEAITSLGADLSHLPAGNNAVFTPGAGNTSGRLTWTPSYADAGTYPVIFTAANTISGTATTLITVGNVDRAPVVVAPANVTVLEANPLTLTVQASDADGEAIASLTADLSALPAGSNAVFAPGPGNTSGTLTWTPTYADSGNYTVTFTAANGLTTTASTVIRVSEVADPNSPGTFFVDASSPACTDLGSGTQAHPYCTISAAVAAHAGPGITIIVKPGFYREQVTIPTSGDIGNPMVIRASAAGAVIDGADDFTNSALWTQFSGNVWLAASANWSPKQVFADGARLTSSTGAPANLAPGTYRGTNGGLYVNVGGGNPAGHQLRVGHRTNGIAAYSESWLVIDGFTITRTEDIGVLLDQCDNIQFTRNTVTFTNKYGFQATGGNDLLIGSNTVSDNNDHGISLTTGVTASTLEDNESFRNARPGTRAANGIYMHSSSGNIVRRNRLHDNQDTGLHFQNGANNNVAYLNRSWNNGDHGYDHLGVTGTIHVCDVAYGNFRDGFSIEGGSPGNQLYNCIATDNGLTTNEFDLWVDSQSSVGFVSDYNLFWNSTSQPPVKYINTLYSSVKAYSTASSEDANTLQADPRFVNPAAGDFHLLAGSPAIDDANSGVAQWPATDVEGHVRADDPLAPNAGVGPIAYGDRGAFEYRPAQLTLTPASGNAPLAVTASAVGSVGPDGTAASFRFDFGDGTIVGPQAAATATHTYAAGNWTATVIVTDQSGGASSASAAVAVNARPTAALTAIPNHGSAPLTVTLNASASADADGQIVSYQFNYGDGLTGAPQSSPITTHSYGTGTWAPIVTVTDNRGATAVASSPSAILVGAPNVPPVARASVTPTSGTAPLAVAVDASQSSDADGVIASYRFDFGDGQFAGPQPTPTASHTYAAGTWPLTVTVVDEDGGTSSTTVLITSIADLGRAPVVAAPTSVSVTEGNPLTVTIHAADPDGQAITSLSASLASLPAGSGAVFTPGPGDTTGTLTWTPDYTHAGSYPVTFTAANALSGSASTMITVQNVDRAPVVVTPGGVRANPDERLTMHVSAADPDGEAITTLTADLSSLPAGDAAFVADAGNTAGTLTWTPGVADSGRYTVTFTAANARTGTAPCVITVGGSDHPPVVVAPAGMAAAEGSPLSIAVQVHDIDGDAILSLTANLAGLPAGNNAVFTPGPGDTTGTLTWTPTFEDAGSYTVTFRASNADSGTATTVIAVANVDRAPVVTAPATAIVHAGAMVTVHVTAADADGSAITSLTADLSGLPAGHNAVFTPGASNTSGTLTWTPAAGDLGKFNVTFVAANALPGSAVTSITVTPPNQAPTAVLTATPATGNGPLTVVADASGSSDGDGTIVSYRFDFGDGTVVGPQAGATASHAYAAGNWNLSVVVTDELGAVGGATTPVIVAAAGAGANLVGNPSFEVNTNGWAPFPGSTMQRVPGGFDGSFALSVKGPDTLGTFGLNDSPNWVTTTPAAGTRYRFSAWVRSPSSGGQARLRVREYQGLVRIGASGYFSNIVGLAPGWKLITLDYVSQLAGTTLDLQVEDTPIAAGETYLLDNVSIRIVPGAAPARAGGVLTEIMDSHQPLQPRLTPNPMRAGGMIGFATSRPGLLQADLFDASGRRVRRLMSRAETAGGWHEIAVDGRDEGGAPLAAGVYFYRIVSVDGAANGRFVLLR